jgi:uncharacterized protein YigA (DUF484 family)
MTEPQNLARQQPTDEEMVIDYLLSKPNFFVTHGDLLTRLQIPHDSGGAVSLVERQIGIYRKKSLRLEKQLVDLLEVARENERIGLLVHQFTVSLMHTETVAAVLDLTRDILLRDFRTDEVAIQLFDEDTVISDVYAQMSATRNVVCGKLSARQRSLLFKNADDIASVALILLHADGANLGVLALGSLDKDRFHPSKGIVFLSQLGNLVSHQLLSVQ